tara:strand:- start:257 stop:490 length:234 start_codon:yes stop_codon:yes gene_type:complete
MKVTKRQLRRIIREEKARLIREAYPVAGEPSNAWIAFEKAVEDAALPMIDAGMEFDGVLQALHDSVDNVLSLYEPDE